MNYLDAMDETTLVTVDEAMAELSRHDCDSWSVEVRCGTRCLVDQTTGQTFASVDDDGMVHSADVLAWLGY